MNWIKQNKFLTGFLVVTLIGAGVLGYLMLSAKGRADEAQQHYDATAAELTRLQNGAPFPDAGNLEKMEELKKQHHAAIDDLQKKLAAEQIPLEPTTPEQFQDKLKDSVKRVKADAADKNVKLPEKFFMGFDKYETEPPKPEAAAPLLRLLKSMEMVMEMLIANRPSEIGDLKRDTLPEEAGRREGRGTARDDTATGKALVVRHQFQIGFTAKEGNFHKFVNGLVTEKQQFFIPKSIAVENEGPAPSRSVAAPSDPSKPPDPNEARQIVGEEKLKINLKVEAVDFADTGTPAKAEK